MAFTKLSQDIIEKLRYLYLNNVPFADITARLGVSTATIAKYTKDIKRGRLIKKHKLPRTKLMSFNARSDGSVKIKELTNKFGQSSFSCYLTGREINPSNHASYHFDHIIPVSKGGDSTIDNLELACKEANMAKADLSVDEFLQLCKEVVMHNLDNEIMTDLIEKIKSI